MDQHVFRVWIKYRGLCLKVRAKNLRHSFQILTLNWPRFSKPEHLRTFWINFSLEFSQKVAMKMNCFSLHHFYLLPTTGCFLREMSWSIELEGSAIEKLAWARGSSLHTRNYFWSQFLFSNARVWIHDLRISAPGSSKGRWFQEPDRPSFLTTTQVQT